MNVELLSATVFDHADRAHLAHLTTDSFAKHEALGEFYAAVRVATDELVEAAIGLELPAPVSEDGAMLDMVENGYVDLVNGRDEFCQGSTVLENLYDNLTHAYAKASFKLRRFTKP